MAGKTVTLVTGLVLDGRLRKAGEKVQVTKEQESVLIAEKAIKAPAPEKPKKASK